MPMTDIESSSVVVAVASKVGSSNLSLIYHLSFRYGRDFYFKHADSRSGKDKSIKRVNLVLNDGLLLLMEKPTNRFWYHALPRRKNSLGTRINLTFRKVK